MTWTPRSPQQALLYCDTLLADLTPLYRHAIERLEELQPGHSGRPAGNGEPGGGHSYTATSIVERTTLTTSPERSRLERARALPALLADQIQTIAGQQLAPKNPTDSQRLALVAWITRQLAHRPHLPVDAVRRFHSHVCELHDIVTRALADPHHTGRRSPELAADLTETWCTSCLRVGAREPRNDRYATHGLCRWCGDFQAEQGWLPTLPLLEARRDRRRITEAMVAAERPNRKRRRR